MVPPNHNKSVRVQDENAAALECDQAVDPGHDAEDRKNNLPQPLDFLVCHKSCLVNRRDIIKQTKNHCDGLLLVA